MARVQRMRSREEIQADVKEMIRDTERELLRAMGIEAGGERWWCRRRARGDVLKRGAASCALLGAAPVRRGRVSAEHGAGSQAVD